MIDTAPRDFYTKLKDGWGVTEFDITGDTKSVLRAGVSLALLEHKEFKYYRVVENENGSNELHFSWYRPSPKEGVNELPFVLRDVEAAMLFIGSWIQENGKYDGDGAYDGDGTNTYGFRLTNKQEADWRNQTEHMCLRVVPTFVYYGK